MKFDESEFKNMRWNIRKLKEDDEVLFKFPELGHYEKVFAAPDLEGLDRDFVLRYLIYLFDTGSPARHEANLNKRKAYVMMLLGRTQESLSEKEVKMMRWKNKGVNKRAIVLLMLLGGPSYTLWQRETERLMQLASLPIELDAADIETRKKAADTEKVYGDLMKASISVLNSAKDDFLAGEKSKDLEDELVVFTLNDSLGLRPEEYIRNQEHEGNPFPNDEIDI